jgi:stage III sporulation protein AH
MAEARLSREQVRTRNEETLNSIINNENLSQEQRQTAADNLMELTENAQIEADIESALQTKGIAQVLVTINETGVEVLVGSTSLTDAERAQIEDTVKRNANVEASEIVISLMNGVNTEVVEEP